MIDANSPLLGCQLRQRVTFCIDWEDNMAWVTQLQNERACSTHLALDDTAAK